MSQGAGRAARRYRDILLEIPVGTGVARPGPWLLELDPAALLALAPTRPLLQEAAAGSLRLCSIELLAFHPGSAQGDDVTFHPVVRASPPPCCGEGNADALRDLLPATTILFDGCRPGRGRGPRLVTAPLPRGDHWTHPVPLLEATKHEAIPGQQAACGPACDTRLATSGRLQIGLATHSAQSHCRLKKAVARLHLRLCF